MMMEAPSAGSKRKHDEKLYRGIRMRKWGKWVAEIREPNKRSRIWLGSYSSPVAAARAYDTAVFHLRGPSARLNFPAECCVDGDGRLLSAADIRKRATEVGARVDAALQTAVVSSPPGRDPDPSKNRVARFKPDLNEYPTPESSEEEDC
ncbi:unnamed protein product [Cuscuta campestris]|uniref:AP2/ERF domain-containing protein n=1 Tax=Cuscuta campestris TaxID=132261 RepID=A0A484KNW4_9ASTE|nr:unnamed protein product [Cuscuta campestris]